MLINLRNALMTGKRLPYKRQVDYIDTNGGGCTMGDIIIAPEPGFVMASRFAVVTGSGDQMIGNCRTKSDHDRTGYRLMAINNIYSDIAACRINTSGGVYTTNVFADWNVCNGITRDESYIEKDGVRLGFQFTKRNYEAGSYPLNICTYSNLGAINGRLKISTLTLRQGSTILADIYSVETNDGKAGLYDVVGGNVYTSTIGNEFLLPTP